MSVSAVTKNGRSCWQVQVIRGSRRIRRYLDRKRFLRQHALGLERQLLADLDAELPGEQGPSRAATPPPPTPPRRRSPSRPPEPLTFAAFAERYLALQDRARSDYKNKVRNLRLHLIPVLGDLPLAAITRMRIDELRVAHPRRRALRAVLRLAGDYDLIDKVPRIPFEPDTRKDPAFLDFDEAEAFLAAAPGAWRLLLRTAIRTGLRRGELLELRWGTSTSRRRRRSSGSAGRSGRSAAGSGRSRSPRAGGRGRLYAAVRQTARDAGLRKHVHPHLVQKWLGHASVTTTERYAHLRPDTDDELIDVLELHRSRSRGGTAKAVAMT